MSDNPNRRKDDARPAVALQWGDRPDHWTLLLTGPTAGVIGPLGSTWPNHPAELERVDVCVRRKDGPAVVYRTGGEGATTWHQFYPCSSAEPLRDGEYLYREGAVPKLDSIEQYRLQMAAIGTAAIGYWKLGDSIHPDYDTVPLRDVAALHARYDELSKFRESVRGMVQLLKNREWAEDLAATGDAAELQSAITKLLPNQTMHPDDAAVLRWADAMADKMARSRAKGRSGWHDTNRCTAEQLNEMLVDHLGKGDPLDVAVLAMMLWSRNERTTPAQQAAPDAVEAAMTDAIVHGTGAFTVKADGSTEHVDLQAQNRAAAEIVAFSPPAGVRDALYRDYVVPTGRASSATCTIPGCQAPATNRLLECCDLHEAEFRQWEGKRDVDDGAPKA